MNPSVKKHDNRDIQEHIHMGENLFAQGKTVEAIECFQSALTQDPENTTALNNLGVIAYQLNDGQLAEDFLVKAVRLNRRDPESLGNLIDVYLQQGAQSKARPLLDKARLGGISLPDPSNCFSELPLNPEVHTSGKQSILAPQKILVINNLFPPQELGGYGRIMADYVDLLRQRGHQVLVLTSDMRAFGLPPESEPQVQRTLQLFGEWTRSGLIEYPRERILEINAQNEQVIYRILNYFHPDLCLAGNLDLLSVWVFRPFFARCIPVVHQIGNEFIGYHAADSPQSPLYHVVTASQWLKEEALRRGYPFQKACAIYSGAFTGQFQMVLPPATDRLRIAYAGLVNGYKGPQVLIEALNLLARKNIPFSCTVAGGSFDSLFVESQKNRVQALGLSDKIRFAGLLNREGLKDLFARHNVLVFPSLVPETFGISQVEAMAAGLLVISSATGGAREVILDNETGLYFKAGDYSRLAFLLMEILQDRSRWERLALAGEQYALSHFDIESSVDQLEEVFKQALEDQKGGT